MRRYDALRILQEHEDELRKRDVLHMPIFRSVARDEAGAGSDVDLLADFDPDLRLDL
jgi:predicted nucleotidyltransferase